MVCESHRALYATLIDAHSFSGQGSTSLPSTEVSSETWKRRGKRCLPSSFLPAMDLSLAWEAGDVTACYSKSTDGAVEIHNYDNSEGASVLPLLRLPLFANAIQACYLIRARMSCNVSPYAFPTSMSHADPDTSINQSTNQPGNQQYTQLCQQVCCEANNTAPVTWPYLQLLASSCILP